MRKTLLLLAAVAAALALSGSALAALTPRLVISTSTQTTTLEVRGSAQDDPSAKISIYVPTGYTAALTQPAGTQIGTGTAKATAKALPGAELPLTAKITTADPAQHTTEQCAPGTHTAVWILTLSLPGTPDINVPIYVDQVTGPLSAAFAYQLQVCLASPSDPQNTAGAQVTGVTLSLDGVFTAPATETRWRSLFTPYTPGTTTPNPTGTVEADAVVDAPGTVSLRARATKGTRAGTMRVALTGSLVRAGAGVAGTVRVLRTTPAKTVATLPVPAAGSFATAITVRQTARPQALAFTALATVPGVETGTTGCDTSSPFAASGVRCVSSSTSGFIATSASARVTVAKLPPKPKPKKRR